MDSTNYDFITKNKMIVEKIDKPTEEVSKYYASLLTNKEKGE